MEAVTIRDVALRSGYSVTTVSRVLSGSNYPVNEETRLEIQKCASSLGYVPNLWARSLKTNTSKEIAVVVPSLQNPFYTSVITGVEDTISRSGYSMLVYLRKRSGDFAKEFIASLASKMVAGILIATNCIGTELADLLRVLQEKGTPVVVFDDSVEGYEDLRGVFFDYHRGGRLAAQTLYQCGHTNVALITIELSAQRTRRSFVGGFCEYYREVGCPLREDLDIFQTDETDDLSAGMKLAAAVLDAPKKYTAIAANNDCVAVGAISAITQRGLRIPADLSVIGMDDSVYSRMTAPPLTTVGVPAVDMGSLAANQLLGAIQGKPMGFSIYMHSGLMQRQTIWKINHKQDKGEKKMHLYVETDKEQLGQQAAKMIAQRIQRAIALKGEARIVLSTGASQFETLAALVKEDVDWSKVTMFHLDEYVNLPITHIASFRKYLTERFVEIVHPKEACFVNGEGDVEANIEQLTQRLTEKPIDVGVIGIGENAHIAFNDPPADFSTTRSYIVVNLNERCKKQQVGEGWFATVDDVPKQAISMTPYRIMQCECIVAPVPKAVKAEAIAAVLRSETVDPMIPGTLLKTHPDCHLFVDRDSASLCSPKMLKLYQ